MAMNALQLVTKKDFKVGLAEFKVDIIKWVVGMGIAIIAAGFFR